MKSAIAVLPHGWLALLSLAATCLFAMALRQEHHRCPRPKRKLDIAVQFLLVWCVFGSGIWFALAAEHWLLHGPLHLEKLHTLFLLLSVLGVIGFSFWHSRLAPGFYKPRNLSTIPAANLPADEQLEALILCVSPPNHPVRFAPSADGKTGAQIAFGETGTSAHLTGKLEHDIRAISEAASRAGPRAYWNWQPMLRSLAAHPRLKHICLVGSVGANGSFCRLEQAQELLQLYTPARVERMKEPVDFENFDLLVESIRSLLNHELRDVAATRVAIDITGGQKVASIAGAALTMNRELRFQYVQTNPPFAPVIYQLTFDSPPSPHGH